MTDAPAPRPREGRPPRPKRDIHGWVVLDKPVGMTSTHAVAVVRRLYQAKKAGHAGTLDPLASGALPIALGEATKTVPFVMDGRKVYRFTVQWGEERNTDDSEGTVIGTSPARPEPGAIEALLPEFTGEILQTPPRFSALKIDGERAYDLARDGAEVDLAPRPVVIDRLQVVDVPDPDHAVFEATCGKGTYVRALARDFGRRLGCLGHVVALRRTAVGPFEEAGFVSLEAIEGDDEDAASRRVAALAPVEAGLAGLPHLAVGPAEAGRLARGQAVILRGRDAPVEVPAVYVTARGRLIALGAVESGELVPRRVFQLGSGDGPR